MKKILLVLSLVSSPLLAMDTSTSQEGSGTVKKLTNPSEDGICLRKECIMCMEEKSDTEFTRLTCGHSYCTNCVQETLQYSLKIKNTRYLSCVIPDCGKKIATGAIKGLLSDQSYKVLCVLIERERLLSLKNSRECTTPDCQGIFIAKKTREEIECKECKKKYCSDCRLKHPIWISCQASRPLLVSPQDKASDAYIRKTCMQCPKCSVFIELALTKSESLPKQSDIIDMKCRCGHIFDWSSKEPV